VDSRALGRDGLRLSVVGLGCNNFGMRIDEDASVAVVQAALDAGITHFDTAESYGGGRSEVFLGKALGARRGEAVIATKYLRRPKEEPYEPGILARRIREGCEHSLQSLGTDHIDLYYQHWPDPDAPVEEALETLDELVREGKVLHLASSNSDATQMRTAERVAVDRELARFEGAQIEWNLLRRAVESSTVPAARELGVGVVPYFPLASGLLTGKYRRGEAFPEDTRFGAMPNFATSATDENFDRVDALGTFATSRGHTLLELAIAWLAAQGGVTSVICGATTPAQVRANARAAEWVLTDDDLAAVPVV
jgi:aryl-alcohol dehydrogenase-like predicted oxidoreductase